jgi:uncharacterized UBP type Zn finger protein
MSYLLYIPFKFSLFKHFLIYQKLCLLGFPRDQAIQAYFACDKNEELAANFLFDQPDDEDLQ